MPSDTRAALLAQQKDRSKAYLPKVDHDQVRPFFAAMPDGEVQVCAFAKAPEGTITSAQLNGRLEVKEEDTSASAEQLAEAETARYTRGKAEGLAEGKGQGRERGRAEGAAEKAAELEPQLAGLGALAEAFEAGRAQVIADARASAIQLAFQLAERIVAKQLDDADVLGARLRATLDGVSDVTGERLRVRTAATQLQLFRAIAANDGGLEGEITFEADPALEPGDLIVDVGGRQVASVIKDQLARLQEVLDDA